MGDGRRSLLVVGGGIAGLSAALRAAELGLDVCLVEKGAGERYPCNTRMSGGIIHVAYNDVKRPTQELEAILARATAGRLSADLAHAFAVGAPRLVNWLLRHGTSFVRPGPAWQTWTLAPPRPITAGVHWIGRGPDVLLRRLGDALRRRGGTIRLGTRATRLLMRDGRCEGLEVVANGEPMRLTADAVILCDGGFQADPDMVRRHVSPAPGKLKQRGAATGCGDGFRMAQEIGAAASRLDRFYGHLLSRDAMTSDAVWPYPDLDAVATAGILVGPDGRRFADEGRGGIFLANAVAALPDPLSSTIVFDSPIWSGPGRSARIPANPHLARAGGTIHRAHTLPDLAALAGLDPDGLARTVEAHNAALHIGAATSLGPERSTDRYRAFPIREAPFYAVPACAGITYTMGGLRIDEHARVLADGDCPIPGLYAAGSIVGDIEGGDGADYLGGLSKAGVFGIAAAEHAAASDREL
ncbi:FAD-dependent oxidoreductase [uncultured Enterovirga sp.]|uniref:FAD-dependent oxidoreductase n=1 Tax=uncultured Enterovirga sp. TaxID=2026352 RepID=UPI0035CBBF28